MNKERLNKLRRKQLIYINVLLLLFMIIYYTLLYFPLGMSIFFILLGITSFGLIVIEYIKKFKYPIFSYLFPSLKPLYKYNKEKSYTKKNRNNIILSIILSILLINLGITWDVEPPITIFHYSMFGFTVVWIFLLVNIGIISNNNKMEKNK
ncbi:hypothetical protein GOQ27_07495 [Clostridium sp. D2Q-11]|uniref:Uncharacterized protein n=1 Tax=Anaeromonas frigoriresistens TaxID=2683708 RepID=A0A942UTJ6_9FIRM|nr:hypothetical protein [Anaeromonas frigoriresistens]MBS4538303.1 hypothetical protein [Anaeromonas frigoriresistens]